jgi:putative CocE/NonD family hydrolase
MPPVDFARRAILLLVSSSLLISSARIAVAQAKRTAKEAAEDAENATYFREHYAKYEYKIAMRDGVKLFTSVYAPKDDSQRYPILLTRTPYSCKPYGVDVYPTRLPNTLQNYAKEGFIFVIQDVRGRFASEGEFVHMRPHRAADASPTAIDESTDAFDTIDWLVRYVPNNNGRVGMIGISYPGFYAATGMIDSHPALKCSSPQAPACDWFMGDDFHHNGTFYLPHALRWFWNNTQPLEDPTRETAKPFDFKTPDGYEFFLNVGPLANMDRKYLKGKIAFWDEMMKHGTYDEFWQARDLRRSLKNIKCAVMTVGGWYDAEDLFGTFGVYREIERSSRGTTNLLVMGPWGHGDWAELDADHLGNVQFFSKTGPFYREQIELRFLKHYLKEDGKSDLPKAYVFETGTDQWRRYDSWPPKNAHEKTLYFHADGKLSFEPPAAKDAGFDEYLSDPNRPVPFIPNIAVMMTREHMLDDQRFAATRPDVLVYQTEPLEDDVTLAGPIAAKLFVSTSGTDSDFVVKLIDVYSGDYPNPDPNPAGVQMGGYQQLVRGEAMRGKFRNSFEKPEPFEPGKLSKIEFVLPDIYHTFRPGHRIMIHVQSSWFPLVDRNPQKFCDIYHASADDFQKADERVYHSPESASEIRVKMLTPAR